MEHFTEYLFFQISYMEKTITISLAVLISLYVGAFTACIIRFLCSLNNQLRQNWADSTHFLLWLHQICVNDVPRFLFLASSHLSIPSTISPSLHLSPIVHSPSPPPGPGDPSWSSCGPPAGWRWAPAARTAGGPSRRWWAWGCGSRSTWCGKQT